MRLSSWIMAIVLCLGATADAGAAQSQLGLKLGVQPWLPVTNDDTVQFLLDDPAIISRFYDKHWPQASEELTNLLKAALSTPNLVADEVSFYDIDLQLTQPLLTIDRLDGSGIPGDPYHLTVEAQLNSESVTLTSTTPTVCDSGCDPRCNFVFDAKVKIDIVIQNTVGAAFSSPQTQPGSEPIVQITRFDFAAGNLVCGVAVGLVQVLGLKDAIGRIVAQPNGLANKPLADVVRGLAVDLVASLNSTVAAYQRPEINLLILRAWLLDQPGGGKTIVLNLAPRAPLPDPSAGQGGIGGVITAGAAQGIKSGQSGTVDCSQLPVTVSRITGPRPMTSPYGTLGEWPLEALSIRADCDAQVLQAGQQSNYRISGMSVLFPQIVLFGSVRSKCTAYEASVRQGIDVKTPWVQGVLLPQDLYSSRDLMANFTSIVCGGQAPAYVEPKDRFLKYLFDKQDIAPNPIILEIAKQYVTSLGLSQSFLQTFRPKAPIEAPKGGYKVQSATPPTDNCSPNSYSDDPASARVTSSVNVRAGDSTDCKVVGQLPAGRTVDVLSCALASGASSNWCLIDFGPNGSTGFVSKRYLALGSDAPVDDIEEPAPDDDIVLNVPNGEEVIPGDEEFDDDLPDGQEGEDTMQDDQQGDEVDLCTLPRPEVYCAKPE